MAKITNLVDFEPYFPNIQKLHSEWKSACPFCPEESGQLYVQDGRSFVGEDRMVWFLNSNRVFCRECQRQGRGKNGTYGLRDLGVHFELEVGRIQQVDWEPVQEPLTVWSDETVEQYHAQVDRDYWYNIGWDDDVIDRFRLGRGYISGYNNAHTIPMDVRRVGTEQVDKWYGSGRQDGGNRKLRGSISYYVWEIINNPKSDTVLIAEGEKDAITLAWLFPEYNVIASFGSTFWNFSKTVDLMQRGYKNVWVFQDNDEAGESFGYKIAEMAVTRYLPLEVQTLFWEEAETKFGDVTDGLEFFSGRDLRDFLEALLHSPQISLDLENMPANQFFTAPIDESQIVSLSEIRADEGVNSLNEQINTFISTYASLYKRGQGRLKLIKAPPGAGKSYRMVKNAEEHAFHAQIDAIRRKVQLQQMIDDLAEKAVTDEDKTMVEQLRKKLAEFSVASVAWLGQYKEGWADIEKMSDNPALWFNFEARSEDNCANYDLVQRLGANNHHIGSFCKVGCPHRETCVQSGYLAQEQDMKNYPITFFRHQHLGSSYLTREKYSLIVIDENPTAVMETPITAYDTDVIIHDAMVAENHPEVVILFDAVRATMGVCKPKEVVSGADFLKILNKQILTLTDNAHNLVTLLAEVDDELVYDAQPNFISGDEDQVLPRVLPQLVIAIRKELADFTENPDNQIPSAINCVYGKLEIYTRTIAKIPKKTPIVVLDATAFPKLYDGMFGRTVEVFAPAIRNKKANVVVLRGSDFTKSQVNRELSKFYDDIDQILAQTQVTNLLGEVVDLSDVQGDPFNIFESSVLRQVYQLAHTVSSRHGNTLVVTHKIIRKIMEAVTDIPNVDWGHYGALRGTNKYEDYPAILLIGAYRVPYDTVYRKVAYWSRLLGWFDPIDHELIKKQALYHGTVEEGTYISSNNILLDQYIHMVEAGELIQSAERIRPHSTDEQKFVYLAANRPALNYVTTLGYKKDFIDEGFGSKTASMEDFMRTRYATEGKFPTYAEIIDKFHIGRSKIAEARKRIKEEFDNDTTPTVNQGSEHDLSEMAYYPDGSPFNI